MGNRIAHGAVAGIVFGVMMAMMGTLKMIAGMVGSSSPVVGFLVHIMISAVIGAGFGLVLGGYATSASRATASGVGYGFVWWILGPLTIMPMMMGMGIQWSGGAMKAAMPSLIGHLIYGAVLGFVYSRLHGNESRVHLDAHA